MPKIPLLEVKKKQFNRMNEKLPASNTNSSFYFFKGEELDISEQRLFWEHIREIVENNRIKKAGA